MLTVVDRMTTAIRGLSSFNEQVEAVLAICPLPSDDRRRSPIHQREWASEMLKDLIDLHLPLSKAPNRTLVRADGIAAVTLIDHFDNTDHVLTKL